MQNSLLYWRNSLFFLLHVAISFVSLHRVHIGTAAKYTEKPRENEIFNSKTIRDMKTIVITNGQKITQTIAKADVVEFLKRLEGFAIDRVHIEDKFNKDDILGEQ